MVVSQEVVILYFQIIFKGGPESKCTGIFSSNVGKLKIPKRQNISYGHFLIVTQSDVNNFNMMFFSNGLHEQLGLVTSGIPAFFPHMDKWKLKWTRYSWTHFEEAQSMWARSSSTQHMEDLQKCELRGCCRTSGVIPCGTVTLEGEGYL